MTKPGVLLLLLLLAFPAAAKADDAAMLALYAKGDYAAAMNAGAAAHTATGYTLAARAAMADAALREAPCMDCLQHAEALARQAIAADPRLADGQIWLAVALGYQARIQGMVRARLRDLPDQSKAALDAAIASEPANPFAVSALGGWNIEVVKGGGPFLANHLYGATTGAALALFDRAVKLAPGNVAVRYQIALSLAGFDPDAYRARIAGELDAAIKAVPVTAYEKVIQARASELKAALNGSRPVLDAKVRKFQGYP
jgi:tetratricopeptide (TPR) repeat protein